MTTNKASTMHGVIDFLPESYREHNEQRTFHIWQLLALVLLTVMVAVASIYRHHVRRGVDARFAELRPHYMAAEADEVRLTSLEEQLGRADAAARLVAYLHHPWPRSQILSALLPALPERITLTSIRVDHVAGGATAGIRNPAGDNQITVPEEEQLKGARLLHAERDLKTLHEQCDRAEVVVLLCGVTTEPGELYAYLGELSRNRLFTKAELVSLESVAASGSSAAGGSKFRARLVVCPGYSQPEGLKVAESAARESRETHVAQGGTMRQHRQRRMWLFVLPILAIAVAHVYFFLIPARRQIEELRRNLNAAQTYVTQHADLKKSLAKVESQLAETNSYVNGWKGRGGHPGDISLLFGEINRRAKAAGTTLDSFEPQATTDLESMRKVPLRITLHGSFAQIHEMLRGLEQLPDTMWIESLSIDGNQETDKPLKAEVNLAIFAALPDISD